MLGEGADIWCEIPLATTLAESEDTNSSCVGHLFYQDQDYLKPTNQSPRELYGGWASST